MNAIGLFEAKTKFSEICTRVAASRVAVVVTRRGKPLVRIEPIRSTRARRKSVWDYRIEYEKAHGPLSEDLTLPRREEQTWRDPIDG